MNKSYKRNRNNTLIITEGNHEKNKLLKMLILAFPEIEINEEHIIIYETNIYNLYDKILDEYGDIWEDMDIDLPKCVSVWKSWDFELTKNDFTNVILIFDYERQDPNFSKEKICQLQKYFNDINDNGKLFINYPMVESYLDIDLEKTNEYTRSTFRCNITRGTEYKSIVRNNITTRTFMFIFKIYDEISSYVNCVEIADKISFEILHLKNTEKLQLRILQILDEHINTDIAKMLSYKYAFEIKKYTISNEDYITAVRKKISQIIACNIKKAEYLQFDIRNTDGLKNYFFDELDLDSILSIQNNASDDKEKGFIWILNTSIFIIAYYKSFWDDIQKILPL